MLIHSKANGFAKTRHAQWGPNRARFETAPLISLVLQVFLYQCSLTFDPCTPPPSLFSSAKSSNPGCALTCAFVQELGYMSAPPPHEIAQSVLPEREGPGSGKETGGQFLQQLSHWLEQSGDRTWPFFEIKNKTTATFRSKPLHAFFLKHKRDKRQKNYQHAGKNNPCRLLAWLKPADH